MAERDSKVAFDSMIQSYLDGFGTTDYRLYVLYYESIDETITTIIWISVRKYMGI